MTIRLASIEDAPILAELNKSVQIGHAESWPDIFKWPTDSREIVAKFRELLSSHANRFLSDRLVKSQSVISFVKSTGVQRMRIEIL